MSAGALAPLVLVAELGCDRHRGRSQPVCRFEEHPFLGAGSHCGCVDHVSVDSLCGEGVDQSAGQGAGVLALCEVRVPLGCQARQFGLGFGYLSVAAVLFDEGVEDLACVGDRALQSCDLLAYFGDLAVEPDDVGSHDVQIVLEVIEFSLVAGLPLPYALHPFAESVQC
ncbi:hypothetical protein [Streptomyces sp. DH24]|uniref:hypothetical protein n=1 Tax=Streptomyces sp. DH24 TaxID=3040123 RepID=UPI0024421DEF|nr:hypothetical protein [Streptomyces sp. DH24]MDG9718904.1 hypothetical protein [Streptomyces sp. DH24]